MKLIQTSTEAKLEIIPVSIQQAKHPLPSTDHSLKHIHGEGKDTQCLPFFGTKIDALCCFFCRLNDFDGKTPFDFKNCCNIKDDKNIGKFDHTQNVLYFIERQTTTTDK